MPAGAPRRAGCGAPARSSRRRSSSPSRWPSSHSCSGRRRSAPNMVHRRERWSRRRPRRCRPTPSSRCCWRCADRRSTKPREARSCSAQAVAADQLRRVLAGHRGRVWGVAFDPADPNLLASAGRDRTVPLWNVATGRATVLAAGPAAGIGRRDLAFSPDGSLFAAGASDGTIRVWRTATLRPLGPVLRRAGQRARQQPAVHPRRHPVRRDRGRQRDLGAAGAGAVLPDAAGDRRGPVRVGHARRRRDRVRQPARRDARQRPQEDRARLRGTADGRAVLAPAVGGSSPRSPTA